MPTSSIKKLIIGIIASCGVTLSACGQNTAINTDGKSNLHATATPLTPTPQANIRQFDINEQGVLSVILQTGELWQKDANWQKLGQDFSPNIAPVSKYGKIALADQNARLVLFIDGKLTNTDIVLANDAQMLALPFAMIATIRHNNNTHLARINHQGKIEAVRDDFTVLPDGTSLQIDLQNQQDGGHIAVLAKPDHHTYQHGVLGDDIEAGEIRYLERHTLQDLLSPLALDGQVFEANRLTAWQHHGQNYLISTPAGNGVGASTAMIGEQDGKLTIKAQSAPLPSHRWQSPFVLADSLYAVQMPHLRRQLVRYDWQDDKLIATTLADGISNHKIGDRNTDLSAKTTKYAALPTADYQGLVVLSDNHITPIYHFNQPIRQIKSYQNDFYVLLDDGTLWQLTISQS